MHLDNCYEIVTSGGWHGATQLSIAALNLVMSEHRSFCITSNEDAQVLVWLYHIFALISMLWLPTPYYNQLLLLANMSFLSTPVGLYISYWHPHCILVSQRLNVLVCLVDGDHLGVGILEPEIYKMAWVLWWTSWTRHVCLMQRAKQKLINLLHRKNLMSLDCIHVQLDHNGQQLGLVAQNALNPIFRCW